MAGATGRATARTSRAWHRVDEVRRPAEDYREARASGQPPSPAGAIDARNAGACRRSRRHRARFGPCADAQGPEQHDYRGSTSPRPTLMRPASSVPFSLRLTPIDGDMRADFDSPRSPAGHKPECRRRAAPRSSCSPPLYLTVSIWPIDAADGLRHGRIGHGAVRQAVPDGPEALASAALAFGEYRHLNGALAAVRLRHGADADESAGLEVGHRGLADRKHRGILDEIDTRRCRRLSRPRHQQSRHRCVRWYRRYAAAATAIARAHPYPLPAAVMVRAAAKPNMRDMKSSVAERHCPCRQEPRTAYLVRGFRFAHSGPSRRIVTFDGLAAAGFAPGAVAARSASTIARSSGVTSGFTPNQSGNRARPDAAACPDPSAVRRPRSRAARNSPGLQRRIDQIRHHQRRQQVRRLIIQRRLT